MVILILESVSPSIRGEISRWMIEPKTGVFVGHLSALVRDKIWEKCLKSIGSGGAVQIWSTNNEQRYQMRMTGYTSREIVDFDGIQLIQIPETTSKQEAAIFNAMLWENDPESLDK